MGKEAMDANLASKILDDVYFGAVAAETDDHLAEWFVETSAFRRILQGRVDLVLGPKGAGKTAIYRTIVERGYLLGDLQNALILPTSPRLGGSDFSPLANLVNTDDSSGYRHLWLLFVAVALGKELLSRRHARGLRTGAVASILTRAGLIPDGNAARVGQWLAQRLSSVSLTMVWEGVPVTVGWSGSGGGAASVEGSVLDVGELLSEEEACLFSAGRKAWIMMDRLDELFSGADNAQERRRRALEGLMSAVLDLREHSQFRPLVFIRDDLYGTLSFTNKDHLQDRKCEIRWLDDDLLMLLACRLASSSVYCEWQGRSGGLPIQTNEDARAMVNALFGEDATLPSTLLLSDVLDLLRNSHGQVMPRDLVYLFSQTQRLRLEDIADRGLYHAGEALLPRGSVMQALQLVSRDKLTDFLVGEYPWMSKVVHEIERIGTSSLAPSDLRMVSHEAQAMPVEALQDFLCDIGLLKPVGHRVPSRATSFEVAPLYCPGLGLNLLSDCVE